MGNLIQGRREIQHTPQIRAVVGLANLLPDLRSQCSDRPPASAARADYGALPVATPLHEAREAFERDYILKALAGQQGNISRTADVLGVERSNLYRKMKTFGIAPFRRVDEEEEPA